MIKSSDDYWNDVIDRVRSMVKLKTNWDRADARAPALESIRTALVFIRILINSNWLPPTSAIPTPEGTVCLTWQLPNRHLEFNCKSGEVAFEISDYTRDRTDRGIVEGLFS
jgi:hypothetical protein